MFLVISEKRKRGKEMRTFIKCAAIRAIKTMAQTAVSILTVDVVGIMDVNWVAVASSSALAGIVSILTSIATGLPECSGTELEQDEHSEKE